MAFRGKSYGQVLDISLGGISFLSLLHRGRETDPHNFGIPEETLDLLFERGEIMETDLDSMIVYEHRIPALPAGRYQGCFRMRYGIRFSRLDPRQIFKLKNIIVRGAYI